MEYKYIGEIFISMIKEELEIVTIRELLNKDESMENLKFQDIRDHIGEALNLR